MQFTVITFPQGIIDPDFYLILPQILQTLEAQKESEQIIRRIAEVQEKLQQNESAYTILGAIKSAGI